MLNTAQRNNMCVSFGSTELLVLLFFPFHLLNNKKTYRTLPVNRKEHLRITDVNEMQINKPRLN